MSLDVNSIFNTFKSIATSAVNEAQPMAFVIGKVVSPEPLKIQIDQKLILDDDQILLTNSVRDYYVKLTTCGETTGQSDGKEHQTELKGGSVSTVVTTSGGAGTGQGTFEEHRHDYKGDKWWKVNLKLKANESVLMLRVDGGQTYIILDRLEAPKNK